MAGRAHRTVPGLITPQHGGHLLGEEAEQEVVNAAALLNGSKRPIIFAGQGVQQGHATEVLKQVAEKAQIPVTTSLQGLGVFDERSPLALQMLGMHGSAAANYAIQSADCILGVGEAQSATPQTTVCFASVWSTHSARQW